MTALKIDTNKYVTGTQLAKELTAAGKPTTPQMVTNWKNRGLIQFKHFPELGKKLYIRGSITVKGYEGY